MICPLLKEPLTIADGLDVVVGEGVWCFLIIKYLAHFRSFHYRSEFYFVDFIDVQSPATHSQTE